MPHAALPHTSAAAPAVGVAAAAAFLDIQPLDSEEDLLYKVSPITGNPSMGVLYVAVAVDSAVADHAISVSLDIDVQS